MRYHQLAWLVAQSGSAARAWRSDSRIVPYAAIHSSFVIDDGLAAAFGRSKCDPSPSIFGVTRGTAARLVVSGPDDGSAFGFGFGFFSLLLSLSLRFSLSLDLAFFFVADPIFSTPYWVELHALKRRALVSLPRRARVERCLLLRTCTDATFVRVREQHNMPARRAFF